MALQIPLLGDAKLVVDFVNAAKTIIGAVNEPRSVALEVDNKSGSVLRVLSTNHQHGGFAEAPSAEIPDNTADVFSSQSKAWSIGTGTQGSIIYTGQDFTLTISWNNPFAGSNSAHIEISGSASQRYYVEQVAGSGNQKAHTRFGIYRAPYNPQNRTTLNAGEVLYAKTNDTLVSADGNYQVRMQADGNLVITYLPTGNAVWATNTDGKPAEGLCLQGDCNMYIFTADHQELWSSGTWESQVGTPRLVMQNDGNLVLSDTNWKALWSSKTWHRT